MEYTNLGKSGLKVSRICLGCMSYSDGITSKGRPWQLNEEQSRPFFKRAIELGINYFDTANMYAGGASEEVLGRAIREFANRDEVVIATKVFYPMREDSNAGGLSRKAVMTEVDASLKRLRMDYIDLYQIHRWDPGTPVEETLEALHDVVKSGKARYIGASSMLVWQFCKALYLADRHGWTRFISMQPHYNLLYREEEREMLDLCAAEGMGVVPWSPLARGRLAREWRDEPTTVRAGSDPWGDSVYDPSRDADKKVVDRLGEVSKRLGLPRAQIALAWLLQQPVVTAPIIGATKPHHLEEAVGALDVKLSESDCRLLEQPYVPHAIAGL